jgi:ribosomal protein S18 acetylase RimI-like enzyme
VRAAPSAGISSAIRESRGSLLPLVTQSFTGIYRWHAKRILRSARWVRRADQGGALAGMSMLTMFGRSIGYVYYIAVSPSRRGSGVGGMLLDDALQVLRKEGAREAFACVHPHNKPSFRLFRSREFSVLSFRELAKRDGAVRATRLWMRMAVAPGEDVLRRTLTA